MTKYNPPFVVLKPKPGTWADQRIAKDSGIVGVVDGRYVHVSYEGNLYKAENLEKWEQRVMHAADRLASGYPTIARCTMPLEQFKPWVSLTRVLPATGSSPTMTERSPSCRFCDRHQTQRIPQWLMGNRSPTA